MSQPSDATKQPRPADKPSGSAKKPVRVANAKAMPEGRKEDTAPAADALDFGTSSGPARTGAAPRRTPKKKKPAWLPWVTLSIATIVLIFLMFAVAKRWKEATAVPDDSDISQERDYFSDGSPYPTKIEKSSKSRRKKRLNNPAPLMPQD